MRDVKSTGLVYLDAKQSKEAAEIVMHTMKAMREEMDGRPSLAQRIECAEVIAELAKSLRAQTSIFWSNDGEALNGDS